MTLTQEHQPCTVTKCGNTATGTITNPHLEGDHATKEVCEPCRDEMTSTMGYHIVEPRSAIAAYMDTSGS